jgi:ketosteroid isomerase-like protein
MMNFRRNFARVALAVSVLSGAGSTASAQLVFGSTTTNTANPAAFYLNVTTGQVTTLWNSATNKKVNGLAADQAGARLYANDAALMPPHDPQARCVVAIKEAIEKEIAGATKAGITLAVGTDEVGVAGDLAWHAGTYVVKDKGGKTVDAGKFLEAWERKNGMWRIVRDMWNSDGAPAAPAPEPKKK